MINPNTVSRAWRELEREGTLESRRGAGVYVRAGAPLVCRRARDRMVSERIGRAVAEARAAGLSRREVLELVRLALGAWDGVFEDGMFGDTG